MVKVLTDSVEFVFYRPQARQVFLVGEFNGWRENQLRMSSSRDGYWRAQLALPAGEFKFRYCADGEWFADYAAFGVEPGLFGMDSVVRSAAGDAASGGAGQRALTRGRRGVGISDFGIRIFESSRPVWGIARIATSGRTELVLPFRASEFVYHAYGILP